MAETVELDQLALSAAMEAYLKEMPHTTPDAKYRNAMWSAIRAYLRTAGLVSVPVLKEGEL